eukprot:767015-Prymnesium_polylepis.1
MGRPFAPRRGRGGICTAATWASARSRAYRHERVHARPRARPPRDAGRPPPPWQQSLEARGSLSLCPPRFVPRGPLAPFSA